MQSYTWREAQNRLPQLIADAQAGEVVIILDEQLGAVRLMPISQTPARRAGSARGLVTMTDDFDADLPDFDEYQP